MIPNEAKHTTEGTKDKIGIIGTHIPYPPLAQNYFFLKINTELICVGTWVETSVESLEGPDNNRIKYLE